MVEDENVMKKNPSKAPSSTRHKRLSVYKFVMSDMWLQGPEKWWSTIAFGMRAIFCGRGLLGHSQGVEIIFEWAHLLVLANMAVSGNQFSFLLGMGAIWNDNNSEWHVTSRAQEMMINQCFWHASNFYVAGDYWAISVHNRLKLFFKKHYYFFACLILITKIVNTHDSSGWWFVMRGHQRLRFLAAEWKFIS